MTMDRRDSRGNRTTTKVWSEHAITQRAALRLAVVVARGVMHTELPSTEDDLFSFFSRGRHDT